MKNQLERDEPRETVQAAAYVAELTADLARIARRHRLEALGYLLDMARLEAEQAAGAAEDGDSILN